MRKPGRLGLASFVITFAGVSLLLFSLLPLFVPGLYEGDAVGGPGLLLLTIGQLLLGIATWRAGVLPRWSGLALVVGLLGMYILIPLGNGSWVAYGLGWTVVGYALWSTRNDAVALSEPGARSISEPTTFRSEQREPVEPRAGVELTTPSGAVEATGKNLHPLASQASSQSLVDLNGASEGELAALPGIGIILAKRAVDIRETRGGFRSVEDFGEVLNLKPHKVERIRALVSATPPAQRSQKPDSPGRVVDY